MKRNNHTILEESVTVWSNLCQIIHCLCPQQCSLYPFLTILSSSLLRQEAWSRMESFMFCLGEPADMRAKRRIQPASPAKSSGVLKLRQRPSGAMKTPHIRSSFWYSRGSSPKTISLSMAAESSQMTVFCTEGSSCIGPMVINHQCPENSDLKAKEAQVTAPSTQEWAVKYFFKIR